MKKLFALSLLLIIEQCIAQKNQGAFGPWGICFHLGGNIGGPKQQLEETLSRAGLGASFSNWLGSGSTHYPRTAYRVSYQLGLSYQLKRQGLVSGAINRWNGETEGVSAYYDRLAIRYNTTVVTLQGAFLSADGICRIGAGPSFHFTRTGSTANGFNPNIRAGFTVATGLRIPARSLVFADIDFQYRYAGTAAFGPYEHTVSADWFSPKNQVIPETQLPMSQFFIGIGVGMRLKGAPRS